MQIKKTLVLGASPKDIRFSNKAVKSLKSYNHPVVPLGNKQGKIAGIDILQGKPNINDIHTVALYLGPPRQKEYYQYILSLNPSRIIFNPGTENPELMELVENEGIEVIKDCTLIMLNNDRY